MPLWKKSGFLKTVGRNKFSILFLFLFIVFLFILRSGWLFLTRPLCQTNCQTKDFIVNKGEGLADIAVRLQKEGLVRNALIFQIVVFKEDLSQKIQAGEFQLNSSMAPKEIAQRLTHGTTDVWIRLLEGWRREEIAEKLAEDLAPSGKFSVVEFLKLTEALEGKLFPDTYLFPKDADTKQVVHIITDNFDKKTKHLGVDKNILILASLVEREVRNDVDRPLVAGIMLKRLEAKWPLQVDAAIQYLVGTENCNNNMVDCNWWPNKLSRSDLEKKSPYNTYLYSSLPPAPISNPGLASINAALNSKRNDYWFYLSDNEGNIHYAKTVEEQNKNVQKYLLAP